MTKKAASLLDVSEQEFNIIASCVSFVGMIMLNRDDVAERVLKQMCTNCTPKEFDALVQKLSTIMPPLP